MESAKMSEIKSDLKSELLNTLKRENSSPEPSPESELIDWVSIRDLGNSLFEEHNFEKALEKYDNALKKLEHLNSKFEIDGEAKNDNLVFFGPVSIINKQEELSEVYALKAECYLHLAEEIRSKVGTRDVKIEDEYAEDSDDDCADEVTNKKAKYSESEDFDGGFQANFLKYQRLLKIGLSEAKEFMQWKEGERNRYSSHCLLVGIEILLLLSDLSLSLTSEQKQALIEEAQEKMQLYLEQKSLLKDFLQQLDCREWRLLQQLKHPLYQTRIDSHPAFSLMRTKQNIFFLSDNQTSQIRKHFVDFSVEDTSILTPCFINLQSALDYLKPHVFKNPCYLNETVTIVIDSCSMTMAKQDWQYSNTEQKRDREDEEKLTTLREDLVKMLKNEKVKDFSYDSPHICFYQQNLYSLKSKTEDFFMVQLIFCSLRHDFDERLMFLNGFSAISLNELKKETLVSFSTDNRDNIVLDPDFLGSTSAWEFQDGVESDAQNFHGDFESFSETENVSKEDFSDVDYLQFSKLTLEDKRVFKTLFPEIKEIF